PGVCVFFLHCSVYLRALPSFPTRRSSDLQYLPRVDLFANFNYIGRVPDNRTFVTSVDDDPFTFRSETESFFSRSYWNPSINAGRSEEHTSELQSRENLVCRLLLEKKKLIQ